MTPGEIAVALADVAGLRRHLAESPPEFHEGEGHRWTVELLIGALDRITALEVNLATAWNVRQVVDARLWRAEAALARRMRGRWEDGLQALDGSDLIGAQFNERREFPFAHRLQEFLSAGHTCVVDAVRARL